MQQRLSLILSTVAVAVAAAALLPLGAALAEGVHGQGTWETTLQPRDINGDGTADAFYDTVLNVSWLADNSGWGGRMDWFSAKLTVASLNIFGLTGWRLPTMIDTGALGCDWSNSGGTDCGYNVQTISQDGKTVFSEMAHLYYVSLGNKAYCTPGDANCNPAQPGWGLTNTGGFRSLLDSNYWTGVAYAPSPDERAWAFSAGLGLQVQDFQYDRVLRALAVHPGDVMAVPEPQTYALLLMGVAGVLVAARRRSV